MSTLTMVQVPAVLQGLIDSRLDTIDRMLLGRLPRAERLEIVREVEAQIFELLAERACDEPTREDILAVLGRLDPPEAYLPDDVEGQPALRRGTTHPRPIAERNVSKSTMASRASAIVGLSVILILLVLFPLTIGLSSLFDGGGVIILVFWYGLTLIAFGGSVTAIVLAASARLREGWAVAGLVIGIFALLGSLAFAVLGMML
jgi:hypothetical protein